MPRATVNIEETTRVDLKSCPGGFVELRRLPYGDYLQRQQMAMEMKMQATKGKVAEMDIKSAGLKVAEFEFSRCIVTHNLEDNEGNPLNFKEAYTIRLLDPRIGNEIGDEINKLHDYDSEDLGN